MVLKRAETIKEDSIKVVCRIRPLNSKEKDMESEVAVDFPADEDVHQITHKPTVSGLGLVSCLLRLPKRFLLSQAKMYIVTIQGKKYNFDKVLRPEVTQLQVYEAAAKSIVEGRMDRKV